MKKYYLTSLVLMWIFFGSFMFSKSWNPAILNTNLPIQINEKIIFSANQLEWNTLSGSGNYYVYDFKGNSLSLYSSGQSFELSTENSIGKYLIDSDNQKWDIFLNWKKIFQCNQAFCPTYIDMSGKYIVFIDRMTVKYWPFRKMQGLRHIRVLDIEKEQFRDFPVFKFEGKDINLNWIEGFIR